MALVFQTTLLCAIKVELTEFFGPAQLSISGFSGYKLVPLLIHVVFFLRL